MIDLALYAANKATIRTFAASNNLLDADGNPKDGFRYCWWAGDGKFKTGSNPNTFLAGVVMLLRIYTAGDTISEGTEQWQRSKIAKYIKANGTPGTMGTIPYYELNSVRLFRAADVFSWLAANNLPGHEWLGGNAL